MKYLILIALFFFSNFFYSQDYNTDFSNHEVKLKETIYSVANMYNISADELIEFNPELKEKGIQLGMILKVPTTKIDGRNQDKKKILDTEFQTTFKSAIYETKSYYKEGQIQCKGKYLNGNRIDEWILFYKNGKIKSKVNYGENEKIEEFITYDENGKIIDKRSFLTGEWILFYDNQQIKYKGNYEQGKPVGEWITYYRSGEIKEKRNYSNGDWISYYDNGQIHENGNFLNFTSGFYYDNGRIKGTEFTSEVENVKGLYDGRHHIEIVDLSSSFSQEVKDYVDVDTNMYVEGINYVESDLDINNGQRNGEWISYYENGQIAEKGKYEKGKLIDDWISYYENGKIHSKGNCSNGSWMVYDENGSIWQQGKYEGGKQVGEWIRSFGNNQINFKRNYSSGEWFSYDEKGGITAKGQFEYGKPVGEWVSYFENGMIQEKNDFAKGEWIRYFNNGQVNRKFNSSTGELINFDKNGKVIGKSNRITGESILYFDNGQMMENGYYRNGKKEGVWTYYRENGSVENKESYIEGELVIEDLQKHVTTGVWISYYPEGDIVVDSALNTNNEIIKEKGYYINGQRDGEWIKYFVNGQIETKGFYKNGEREGEWFFYAMAHKQIENVTRAINGNLIMSNSKLSAKHNYKNGKLNGEILLYHDNGQVMEMKYYQNGKLDCRVE